MKKGNRQQHSRSVRQSLKKGGVLRGTRGAVLAEFIIAFMPIMTIYMTMLELAHFFVIREVVVHAANATARACAVVGPSGDAPAGTNGDIKNAEAAGEWALKPWKASGLNVRNIKVACKQADSAVDPYGQDTGNIKADYTCSVPIAQFIMCGNGPVKIDVTSSFPHQGAKYK